MNLVYNWLVNYTHSDSNIIIPLKESSNAKGACICIIEAVAPGTSECTLKDFKNAKNENYYFLNPEHF